MTTTTFRIDNISCHHCVRTIQNELSELPGVKEVQGIPSDKQVTVTYEPPTDEQKIRELLAEINYPAA